MTKKELENQRCRERYHRLKQDPEWYAKRMERNRKNLKAAWKRISENPDKKEKRYEAVREFQKEWIKKPEVDTKRREWRWKLKTDCITAYSNGTNTCKCCGENELKFLTLDHIEGGGNKDRKIRGSGLGFYSLLRKTGYPSGLQVLCFNCNCAKGFFGTCPHMKTENLTFRQALEKLT